MEDGRARGGRIRHAHAAARVNRTPQGFQDLFLDNVVVPAAAAFELGDEYKYLKPSIAAFPGGREQERIARESGFREATHEEVASGLMGLLLLTK